MDVDHEGAGAGAGAGAHTVKCLVLATALALGMRPCSVTAQDPDAVRVVNDSITVRFTDTDLQAAIQALGRYLPKPILTGNLPVLRIPFFETPVPVPVADIPLLLRGLVEAQGLEFAEDSSFYRISPLAEPLPGTRTDAPPLQQPAPMVLNVIRLRHARASDVANTVNQLFGAGGTFEPTPGLSTGTLSDELRRDARATVEGRPEVEVLGGPPVGATLSGPVTIVPDELTNSLLVRSTAADFTVLSQAVQQLDVRPLQVLIEVLIVEARKDRQFSLGIDFTVAPQELDAGTTVEGQLKTAGLGDLVMQVMNLGKNDLDVLITAAHRRGDVRILSRPVLLASNNTEARLMVGSQRPFVQVSRSLPTDTPTRDQVVQYRDVGTNLTVRPTINQDGYVSLVIQQEISAATGETQFDAPVISSREVVTQVLVRDGQTIVMGGLTDEQHDRVRTGIPFLADLPLVGGLFGSTTNRTTETELFLFITPTILRDDEGADRVTAPLLPRTNADTTAAGGQADRRVGKGQDGQRRSRTVEDDPGRGVVVLARSSERDDQGRSRTIKDEANEKGGRTRADKAVEGCS